MAKTSIELAQETRDAFDAAHPGARPVIRMNGTDIQVTKADHVTLVVEFTDGPYTVDDVSGMQVALVKDHGIHAKRR